MNIITTLLARFGYIKSSLGDWKGPPSSSISKPLSATTMGATMESLIESYAPDAEFEALAKSSVRNPALALVEAAVSGEKFNGQFVTIREAHLFTGRIGPDGKLLKDRKVLDKMKESDATTPAEPYRIEKVIGVTDLARRLKEAEAAIESHPATARESLTRKLAALEKLREGGSDFDFDSDFGRYDSSQYSEYTPIMGGPHFKQLYLYDYLSMHSRAFEAWNHNPLAKRIVKLLVQYAMGRGYKAISKDDKKQGAWDKFEKSHKIKTKMTRFWPVEYIVSGELMVDKVLWQSIDPSTIWDIVTDPDNLEDVYYYHQTYPCLHGDTRIALLDGTNPTVKELAEWNQSYWTYSYDEKTKRIVPGLASKTWKVGTKRCVKVTLDSGESVTCTFDHPFLTRTGEYVWAENLTPGQSLMPLYRRTSYEEVWQPTTGWEYTHHMVAGNPPNGFDVHHANRKKTDNTPENLKTVSHAEHHKAHGTGKRLCLAESCHSGRDHKTNLGKKFSAEHRRKIGEANRLSYTQSRKEASSERLKNVWQDPDKRKKMVDGIVASKNRTILEAHAKMAAVNHKVLSVEPAGEHEVYDIQVDKHHNFALSIGVFTHNTRYEQFTGKSVPGVPGSEKTKPIEFIVRQLPYDRVIHMKQECFSNEARGRSKLFPVLGWLKRVKDIYNAQVIKAWLNASFLWDDTIKGSDADIAAHLSKYTQMPSPGSIFAHNESIERKAVQPAQSSSGKDDTAQEIIAFIGMALGIPKEHLNLIQSSGGSRATALIGAEPFTKVIEELQGDMEELLHQIAEVAFDEAGMEYEDGDIEFVFPSVTKDTTTETVKNIMTGEQAGFLSKSTAATMYAGELNITTYDYDEEKEQIDQDNEAAIKSAAAIMPTQPPGQTGQAPGGPVPVVSGSSQPPAPNLTPKPPAVAAPKVEPPKVPAAGVRAESPIHGQGKQDLKANIKRL